MQRLRDQAPPQQQQQQQSLDTAHEAAWSSREPGMARLTNATPVTQPHRRTGTGSSNGVVFNFQNFPWSNCWTKCCLSQCSSHCVCTHSPTRCGHRHGTQAPPSVHDAYRGVPRPSTQISTKSQTRRVDGREGSGHNSPAATRPLNFVSMFNPSKSPDHGVDGRGRFPLQCAYCNPT